MKAEVPGHQTLTVAVAWTLGVRVELRCQTRARRMDTCTCRTGCCTSGFSDRVMVRGRDLAASSSSDLPQRCVRNGLRSFGGRYIK